ncbi:MAG: tetratricopeptide repeat protein [Bradymonadia bacterium]
MSQPLLRQPLLSLRVLLFSLPALLTPVIALGQEGTELTKAQSYVELAEQLYQAKDYGGALEEFRRAEPLATEEGPRAIIRLNIAQCLLKLGRKADAVEAFEAYLELKDDTSRQAKIREKVSALAEEAFGRLNIECQTEGAHVQVPSVLDDGSACPWQARVRLGQYTVTVTRDGYEPQSKPVEIKPGVEVQLSFTLSPAPPPARTAAPSPADSDSLMPWIVTGAGGALLVVGGGLTLAALDSRNQIDGELSTTENLNTRDTYEGQVTASYIAYGIGGAAVIGGLAWWYFSSEDDEKPNGVIVGPGSVGFRW